MNEIFQRLLGQALQLSDKDPTILIDSISFDKPDEVVDPLWMREAKHRTEGYRAGRMHSAWLDTVLNKYQING